MHFAVDANETPVAVGIWNQLFSPHTFTHIGQLGLSDVSDIQLYEDLAEQGFDVLITRDRRQLKIPGEKSALKASGLHWIGHKEPAGSGITQIGRIVSSYCLALPHITAAISSSTRPLRFLLKHPGSDAGQVLNAFHLDDDSKYTFPNK